MSSNTSLPAYTGKTAVIVGGGVIGASWAALFLFNGLRVVVSDPDPVVAFRVRSRMADVDLGSGGVA